MCAKLLLTYTTLLLLGTGCGIQQHPNYSALKKVPSSQMTAVKKSIQNGLVKHTELPTKLPFTVTTARMQTSIKTMKQTKRFMLWMSGGKHVLTLTASPDPGSKPPSQKAFHMKNEQVTHLSHGKKALYGNNGRAAMMIWAQNAVEYSISSVDNKNKPDLTKQQLIKVADSFS